MKLKCLNCGDAHTKLMCPLLPSNQKLQDANGRKTEFEAASSNEPTYSAANASHACRDDVLMKTVLVRVVGQNGSRIVRLIFDEGSQQSIGGESVITAVGSLKCGEEWTRNVLFGGISTEPRKISKYKVQLQSLDGKCKRELMLNKAVRICGEISRIPSGPWITELQKRKIWLSDYEQNQVGNPDIEILIGSDYWGHLVIGKRIRLSCGLVAVETIFGWTLSGPVPGKRDPTIGMMSISTFLFNAEASLKELWDLEKLGITDPAEHKTKKESEQHAYQHFLQTVSKSEEGRYSVCLPWIEGATNIPNNRVIAEKRLLSITAKLNMDDNFARYDQVFKDWMHEDLIEEVQEDTVPCHYLPHRPIIKLESKTTPIRPVFDASCKVGRNPSLNECLEKGPNLIELIPALLLRFRLKKIGVISDIRKAFQMIEVAAADRDFLRLLWWDEKKNVKIFRHKRVVFGVNCSPFLLGGVIEHHLDQVQDEEKDIAIQLLDSLYVDNCVTSVDSQEDYENFKEKSSNLLLKAKMDLQQWERSALSEQKSDFTPELASVLGLIWDKNSDVLSVNIPTTILSQKISKRFILSQVQKIFDPLGFVSPVTLIPKLLLQKTWNDKTEWDEELNPSIKEEFEKWLNDMKMLENVKIPRWVFYANSTSKIQFHVFCDASQYAYAAAVYVRVQDAEKVTVQLLQAKARVAPLKKMTIPRLELLGCVIAARLSKSVKEALSMDDVETHFWSDSTTALAWIKRNDVWGTFVGNRVKEICSISKPEEWRHVPGLLNPADLPSRGSSPANFVKTTWWEGPDWLKRQRTEWPSGQEEINEDDILIEMKKASTKMLITLNGTLPWYLKMSASFYKNIRIIAFMKRFIRCLKKEGSSAALERWEICEAEKFVLGRMQTESFPMDANVIEGIRIERAEDGLIRVKTKIVNMPESCIFTRPILLPRNSLAVAQLIRTEHYKNNHAGLQIMMSKLREKYWIVHMRRQVKNVIRSCVVCSRFTCKKTEVPTAPLPEDRVKTASIFQVVGIDLAGPFFLKDGSKAWMVLFTCAVYRAIHLELVTSLSAEAFLLSLHRFISRRGRPSTIYTDNGTNFEGANNAIKLLDWAKIQKETQVDRIFWKFNVPASPWWGGWWERLIRICKDLSKRMLGRKKLNLPQLETCMFEVEAIVNSRPLTYISEDQDDLVPLTPAMFLRDIPAAEFPEEKALDAQALRNQHRDLCKLRDELKSRFVKEYLSQLVQRGTEKKSRIPEVGDIVLIESDDKKRIMWPMARIMELFPGRDGHIRVAKLKTSNGTLTRPMQRLFPLEVSTEEIPPINHRINVSAQVWKPSAEKEKEFRTRFGRKVIRPVRMGMD